MAQAPKTVFTYPLNGTQRDFPIAFEYLARKFVRVTLLGANARKELVLNTDYRFTTKVQITTTQAWGAAEGYDTIEIRRYTSAEERLVDFNDGSILRAFDLNLSQIQTLHVAEEARDLTADTIGVNQDGNLDARGRKIVNLANGINDTDAVNLGQLRQFDTSTANNADRAEAAKNRAVQAETNTARDSASASVNATKAVAAAGTAVQAASDANQSYSKIVPLEQSTVANAAKAQQQADRAQSEADRAKTEADKLGNMNDFASTISSVDTTLKLPYFKNGIALGNEFDPATSGATVIFRKRTNGIAEQQGYVGLAAHSSTLFVTAEKGRLELQGSNGGVGITANEGDFNVSSNRNIGMTASRIELTSTSGVGVSGALNTTGVLSSSTHIQAGAGRYNSLSLYSEGDGVIPQGNWTGRLSIAYGGSGADVGILSGAATGTTDLLKIRINTGTGAAGDFNFYPTGSLRAEGKWTLYDNGNIGAPIFHGGTLFDELNGTKQWRSPDPNRVRGWTALGNGLLELYIDGRAYGVSFFASDKRLKESIISTEVKATETIKDMRFVDFDWGNEATFHSGHVQCGLIAQQVKEINEQFVTGNEDTGYLQLHVQNLLTLALKALQEQDKRITQLEEKLNAKH